MTGDLSHRRCLRHPDREAAARCTACRRLFCRECVADHDGRMMCAECLASLALGRPVVAPRRFRRALGRACLLGCGFLAAWAYFFVCGQLLRALPAAAHDFAPLLQEDAAEDAP